MNDCKYQEGYLIKKVVQQFLGTFRENKEGDLKVRKGNLMRCLKDHPKVRDIKCGNGVKCLK